jgi:DNA-binding MarR family transcriptional regulator
MSLQGTLREYSLGQLLNLVHIARKSGGLTVQSTSGAADLFFDEGKLVAAQMGQPLTLADIMVQSGKLSPAQASNLTASSGATDDKQLGLLLLNTGQINRDDIVQALRQNMLDVLHTVWAWGDGNFVFDQTRTPPAGRVTIPVSLERILVEGRRQQEQAQPQSALGALSSLDVALRFTEGFGEHLRSVDLSPKEWRVISAINPRNSVAVIAERNGMSEAEIREMVTRLLHEGLVEIAGAPEDGPVSETPSASEEPARSRPTPASAPVPSPAASVTEEPSRDATSYAPSMTEAEPAMAEAEPQAKEGVLGRFLSRFRRSK